MGKFIRSILLVLTVATTANADIRDWFFEVQDAPETQTKMALNSRERQELFNYVVHHKVAATTPENEKKYDPEGKIGYCYGRAMAVHLRARRMGLKPDSIRKLFIVGDLRQSEKPEWRFHVTTLIKGTEGGWYAVDPILKRPFFKGTALPMKQWVETVRKIWAGPRVSHLYRVSAVAVLPDIRIFPWPEKETGEKLIELKFKPRGHEGFLESKEEGITYFDLSAEAEESYFLAAKEKVVQDQFDFTRLVMDELSGDGVIHDDFFYNNYFHDLIDDIRTAKYVPSRPLRNRERKLAGENPKGAEIHGTEIHGTEIHGTEIHGTEIHKNLGSIRFFRPKEEGAKP